MILYLFNAICELFSKIDIPGTVANFLGGLLLVLLIFFWNEILFSKKNLTGEWNVENTIISSTYGKYKNLTVVWKMHILQNGTSISGSGEKIKDVATDEGGIETIEEYEPVKRDGVELQGYIERNYLRKTKLFINVIQNGQIRKSRATYILTLKNKNTLQGTFITTAGNAKGTSIFNKNV